jgi:general secretion pathway protein G
MKRSLRQGGFTLLEIMLVVAIIALMVGGAVVMVAPKFQMAKETRVDTDIETLKTDLISYYSMAGNYPTTDQGLKAMVSPPSSDPKPNRWTKVIDDVPLDPWNHPYHYECPGTHNPDGYDLYSIGKEGTSSDQYLGNWKRTAHE